MESHDDVEATKKQSPLRIVEVDFVFSLKSDSHNCPIYLVFLKTPSLST